MSVKWDSPSAIEFKKANDSVKSEVMYNIISEFLYSHFIFRIIHVFKLNSH
jgi:hypothetical protein